MGVHSSILAWRIPWRENPEKLWTLGLHKCHSFERYSLRAYDMPNTVQSIVNTVINYLLCLGTENLLESSLQ